MPASSPRPPAWRPLGDEGVSEVIGFMLTFGIIAMVLVLSMVAFTRSEEDAHERIVGLHAEAVADRVAGIVVEAALFAETYDPSGTGGANFSYRLPLPDAFEGSSFTVDFVDTVSADDLDTLLDSVAVILPDGTRATAQLFQAGAGADAPLCDLAAPVPGGPLLVVYGDHDANATTAPCIFLEAAP